MDINNGPGGLFFFFTGPNNQLLVLRLDEFKGRFSLVKPFLQIPQALRKLSFVAQVDRWVVNDRAQAIDACESGQRQDEFNGFQKGCLKQGSFIG